jgi:hypothetical protein
MEKYINYWCLTIDMAFIRIKKIKGYEYAYLVENIWRKRKKGARQKVRQFLGRIYKPELKNDMEFSKEEEYVKNNSFRQIVKDLIEYELLKHGVRDFFVDFDKGFVLRNNRKAALQINEGFLCNYTLKNLINFKLEGEEAGYGLANVFVEAGIKVPQELFVKIFEKLSK